MHACISACKRSTSIHPTHLSIGAFTQPSLSFYDRPSILPAFLRPRDPSPNPSVRASFPRLHSARLRWVRAAQCECSSGGSFGGSFGGSGQPGSKRYSPDPPLSYSVAQTLWQRGFVPIV
jgi:hypothetical protein